jgi:hypothetical protein
MTPGHQVCLAGCTCYHVLALAITRQRAYPIHKHSIEACEIRGMCTIGIYLVITHCEHVCPADDSWPPSVPGWVYFPSCISPGHHKAEPRETLPRYQTLQALLYAASQQGNVVAVTTEGAGAMLQLGFEQRNLLHRLRVAYLLLLPQLWPARLSLSTCQHMEASGRR